MVLKKNEFWAIPGYNGRYMINDMGIVISKKGKTRILAPSIWRNYEYITLCKNGVAKRYRVHRLIAKLFIPNPLNKPEVNHKNGIKSDNRVENLEWVTPKENASNALMRDAYHRGDGHKLHKLTCQDILHIRKLFDLGVKQATIASIYNITRSNIGSVVHGNTWRHIQSKETPNE